MYARELRMIDGLFIRVEAICWFCDDVGFDIFWKFITCGAMLDARLRRSGLGCA